MKLPMINRIMYYILIFILLLPFQALYSSESLSVPLTLSSHKIYPIDSAIGSVFDPLTSSNQNRRIAKTLVDFLINEKNPEKRKMMITSDAYNFILSLVNGKNIEDVPYYSDIWFGEIKIQDNFATAAIRLLGGQADKAGTVLLKIEEGEWKIFQIGIVFL